MIEKNTINCSVSPYCALLFSRKGNIKFSEVVLVAVHCNCLISCLYDCVNLGLEILQRIFTCLWKMAIESLNFLSSVIEQLTVALLVSLKNLEHLSYPILVLLFVKLIQHTVNMMSAYTYKTLHQFK